LIHFYKRALSESGVLSYKGEVSFSPPFLENFYKYLGSLGLVNLKGRGVTVEQARHQLQQHF